MSDNLIERLRDFGDNAEFEPHMHHVAADRIEAQAVEIARLRAELAEAEARGYRRALEDAARVAENVTGWLGNPYRSNMDFGPNVSAKITSAIRVLGEKE